MLPFCFGVLEAGAAIVRSLTRKMKASTLKPRDMHLSLQQLALGAITGACIGLFFAQPALAAAGDAATVGLSASALALIAGFGVDAVFVTIEGLIQRIFNISPTPVVSVAPPTVTPVPPLPVPPLPPFPTGAPPRFRQVGGN